MFCSSCSGCGLARGDCNDDTSGDTDDSSTDQQAACAAEQSAACTRSCSTTNARGKIADDWQSAIDRRLTCDAAALAFALNPRLVLATKYSCSRDTAIPR